MNEELLAKYTESIEGASTYRQNIAIAAAFLQELGNRDPSAAIMRHYFDKLLKDGYAPGTVKRHWQVIHRLFIVNGLIWPLKRAEAPVVAENDVYAPALDQEVISMMIRSVRTRDDEQTVKHRAFMALSTIYWMRRQELQSLRPEHLDLENHTIYVTTAKHGRQRYHAIPDEIMQPLEDWGFSSPVSLPGLSLMFKDIMQRACGTGIEEVSWHAIRRTGIALAFRAGLDEATITNFARWKRSGTNMALRYGTSRMVGLNGTHVAMGGEDKEVDEQVFAVHPFLEYWK